ncbi:MAG: HAMP domain-containing protein [Gammaproteobacteria bacterium]|nr:HAMP domain-containing protein [Gammaproteobacteria bacterium]
MNLHSIRWRLLVTMLSLTMGVLAALTYMQIQSQQHILKRELVYREAMMREKTLHRAQTFSDNFAEQAAVKIAAFNFSQLTEQIYTAVGRNRDLAYGILMNMDGTVHIHTRQPELEQEILSAPEDLFAIAQKQPALQTFNQNDEEIVEFIVPIPVGVELWGVLRLGFSMANVAAEIARAQQRANEQIRWMVIKSLIMAIISLLIGFIIIFMISARISKPLVELTSSAHELAAGRFSAKIPVRTGARDEVNMLAIAFTHMAKQLEHSYKTLEKHNKAYERFVPYQFLSLLDKQSIIDIHLGDHVEKEMTVLFSDMRDFTAMSETMTPRETFAFINAYLGRMEPVIHKHNGFIDKYIGDAIMALFPDVDDAVQAAFGMLKTLADYNVLRRRYGLRQVEIGVGINTGLLMLGTVGGKNRMDGTVISDAVNLAARLEGLTKLYRAPLLLSEYSRLKLKDDSKYRIRMLDHVKVKGKSESINIYEVLFQEQRK